jgi:hypothetical protein
VLLLLIKERLVVLLTMMDCHVRLKAGRCLAAENQHQLPLHDQLL